jgi:AraC-like DNA-binding protein
MEAGAPFSFAELRHFIPTDKKQKYVPHRHNYYEVFVFTKGGGKHMIDFKEYTIKDNSLHFISPGMIHTIKRDATCVGYVVTFTDELYQTLQQSSTLFKIQLYHNHQLPPMVECGATEMPFVLSLISQLSNEYTTNQVMRDEFVLSCLTSLLIHANRMFLTQQSYQHSTPMIDERVQHFRKWLDDSLAEKPMVSVLADKLGMTPKQLNTLIKKQTGLAPIEHINKRIVIEAKRLLVHTELSVKEIAYALHFDDPAYFGRFFRRHTKETPQQFRDRMRKKYHT